MTFSLVSATIYPRLNCVFPHTLCHTGYTIRIFSSCVRVFTCTNTQNICTKLEFFMFTSSASMRENVILSSAQRPIGVVSLRIIFALIVGSSPPGEQIIYIASLVGCVPSFHL